MDTSTLLRHIETVSPIRFAIPLFRRCSLFVSVVALASIFPLPARAADGNVAYGSGALSSVTTGGYNAAFGLDALRYNTEGSYNTGCGAYALYVNSIGRNNTAIGEVALSSNTTGSDNTAIGAQTLQSNGSGGQNTALGVHALFSNNASNNTAVGYEALFKNTSGINNTATGLQSLVNNTTGYYNTAAGVGALYTNVGGFFNTASGVDALRFNTSGYYNTASGAQALQKNTTGFNDTALGLNALYNNTSGSNNIALGANAGSALTTGSNNIVIGANVQGAAGDANKIRIGKKDTQTATYVAGIYSKGVASATGVAVKIDSTGKLGTVLSSARYKDHIKPMDKASEAILELEPVTFEYKKDVDPDGFPQFGLIAEQVEKIDPSLVVRDEDGKVSTVRYEAVNAMLLNEFLKEHRTVENLKGVVANQAGMLAKQQKQIEMLTAGLQKVHTDPELSKRAPYVAASNLLEQ